MSDDTFHVLDWLRKIRDENSLRNRNRTSEEILKETREASDRFMKQIQDSKDKRS